MLGCWQGHTGEVLRLASVVPKGSRWGFNPALHLTWGRVTWERGSVSIRITQTKTLQFNENFLEFAIPENENKSMCLYTHLKAWFETTPRPSKEDPVFVCLLAGGRVVPVTRHLATKVFKAGLEMSDVDKRGFGWSSFWRGGYKLFFGLWQCGETEVTGVLEEPSLPRVSLFTWVCAVRNRLSVFIFVHSDCKQLGG